MATEMSRCHPEGINTSSSEGRDQQGHIRAPKKRAAKYTKAARFQTTDSLHNLALAGTESASSDCCLLAGLAPMASHYHYLNPFSPADGNRSSASLRTEKERQAQQIRNGGAGGTVRDGESY
jgi:hypothetical protein